MVYCSRCGTQNPDTEKICSNCGAPLYTVGQQYPGSDREHYKRVENECFGLPNGGMIVGLIFGIIIIFAGLSLLFDFGNFWSYIWPLIIIIFGVLILLGALFGRRRRPRRY